MAEGNALNVKIEVEIGTVWTDVSGYSNELKIKKNQASSDYFVFGNGWRKVSQGAQSQDWSLTMLFDTTASSAYDVLADPNTAIGVRVYVLEDTAGQELLSGDWKLVSLDGPNAVAGSADVVKVGAELQSHGAVTRAAVSS